MALNSVKVLLSTLEIWRLSIATHLLMLKNLDRFIRGQVRTVRSSREFITQTQDFDYWHNYGSKSLRVSDNKCPKT